MAITGPAWTAEGDFTGWTPGVFRLADLGAGFPDSSSWMRRMAADGTWFSITNDTEVRLYEGPLGTYTVIGNIEDAIAAANAAAAERGGWGTWSPATGPAPTTADRADPDTFVTY